MKNSLSPSILAADFSILGKQIEIIEENGAPYLHIDVMDGKFVPSISFGMPLIKSIRKKSKLFFDVHLMIENPERYIKEFVDCGADSITIHVESTENPGKVLKDIKALGVRTGISVKPDTKLDTIYELLEVTDMILIMTVEPGFGGQSYIEKSTQKIRDMRDYLNQKGLSTDIEVDGGITRDNIKTVLEAGANVIVMGSSVFRGDIAENVRYFNEVLKSAEM